MVFFKLITWNKVLLQNKTTAVVQLYSIFNKQKGERINEHELKKQENLQLCSAKHNELK